VEVLLGHNLRRYSHYYAHQLYPTLGMHVQHFATHIELMCADDVLEAHAPGIQEVSTAQQGDPQGDVSIYWTAEEEEEEER